MPAVIIPNGKQSFITSSGVPLVGGKLFTYDAGTTNPRTTWADAAQTSPNTNPIILDARGEATVFWFGAYKIQLQDAAGNVLWTVDNVTTIAPAPSVSLVPATDNALNLGSASFSWANLYLGAAHTTVLDTATGNIGSIARTAAEIAAGVTPVSFVYQPGDVRRYGADPTNTIDSTVAVQAAINVASQNLGPAVYIPPGTFKITASLVIAAGKQVNIQGAGKFLSILFATGFTADIPVLDYQGTNGSRIASIHCRGFAIWSNNNLARGISASWVINSAFDDLYFYQCRNGWVGSSSFGNKFRNNDSFSITFNVYVLGDNCNNLLFDGTRASSCNGSIAVTGICDTLVCIGCDFEGITSGGAAITLAPATGKTVNNVAIIGCHFENINGNAILCSGVDANSVTNLVVDDNTITGGFAAIPNAGAITAITLVRVNGFRISNNNFSDWGTADTTVGGTQGVAIGSISTARNGVIENNTGSLGSGFVLTPHNLCDATPDKSIRVANNFAPVNGTLFAGYSVSYANQNEVTIAYSASMAIDSNLGAVFDITATNGVAFTINNPTNGYAGKRIWIKVRNTSGGALGAITWGGVTKVATASPANGFSRTWELTYDGTNWIQTGGTFADIPN